MAIFNLTIIPRHSTSVCKVRQPFTIAKRFYPLKPPGGYKPNLPNSNVPPVNPNSKVPPANPNSIKPTTPPKESTPVTKKEPLPSYTPPKQSSTKMNSIMDNPYVKAKVKKNSKSSGDVEQGAQRFKDFMNNPKMTVENSISTYGLNATEFHAKHGIKPFLVGNTLRSNDPLPLNNTPSVQQQVTIPISPPQTTPLLITDGHAKREALMKKINTAQNMPPDSKVIYASSEGYCTTSLPPIPPSMSTTPLTKQNGTVSEPVTDQMLQKAHNLLKSIPMRSLSKISVDQENQKSSNRFKSITNQPYTCNISEDTDVNSLTVKEGKNLTEDRGLTKKTKKDNSTEFLIESDNNFNSSTITLGNKVNDQQCTPMGAAYLGKLLHHEDQGTPEEYIPTDLDPIKDAKIIGLKNNTFNTDVDEKTPDIVAQGNSQGHLLHAYHRKPYFYVLGNYTSITKGNSIHFSPLQINSYQKQKEHGVDDNNIVIDTKPQFLFPKKAFMKVHEDYVVNIKYAKEFIAFAQNEAILEKMFDDKKLIPVTMLDRSGLTLERALKICQDYDYNVVKAQKHPITVDKKSVTEDLKKKTYNDHEES